MINYFFRLVFEQPYLFLLIVSISLVIYLIIFRKHIYHISDPFLLSIIASAMGTSVVFFMFLKGMMNNYFFNSYFLTQIAYILGLLSNKPINLKRIKNLNFKNNFRCNNFNENFYKTLYIMFSLLYIFFQLYSYRVVGIPLFREESRLGLYANIGYIKRILDASLPVVIYLLIDRFFSNKKKSFFMKVYDLLLLLFVMFALATSGSKSEFLLIIFSMYFYKIYSYRFNYNQYVEKKINRMLTILFILAFFMSLLVIIIKSNNSSIHSAFISLIIRFIKYGDIYIYVYSSDVLNYINKGNVFLKIFKDFLGMLRLIPWEQLPKAIGLQIYQIIYKTEVILGPNPRHNVFGLIYFGYFGSILYSFFIGFLISYVRNKLYYKLPYNHIGGILYMVIVQSFISFNADIAYSLSKLNSFFIIFIPVCLFSYIMTRSVYKNTKI